MESGGNSGNPDDRPHNGIDILCDPAGSEMLMPSYFSLNPAIQQQQQQQQQLQHFQSAGPHPPGVAASFMPPAASLPHRQLVQLEPGHEQNPLGSVKRNYSASAVTSSPSSHVCHICKRVYERADHLTRHQRSHENARPYQCSRCPKRFNRADLLARHEATHDRDGGQKTRSFVKRSDRAAEACINCSASKAKCSDEKPCTRCRSKSLTCRMPSKRGVQYRTSDADPSSSPSEASPMTSMPPSDPQFLPAARTFAISNNLNTGGFGQSSVPDASMFQSRIITGQPLPNTTLPNEMMFFNPVYNPFQDMDFSWNFDFKDVNIPQKDTDEHTPQSNDTGDSKNSSRGAARDNSRGHAAYKRSPWLWEPKKLMDYVNRAKEHLALPDDSISDTSALDNVPKSQIPRFQIAPSARDSIFAMVLSQQPNKQDVPSVPSLDILNYLLQAHFLQDERNCDSWLHAASFDPNEVFPELLGGAIASGATFMSVPAIWQFGLALQEVVRVAVGLLFESANANTRDLMAVQAYMFYLDIGQWCGFNRQMEICEAFLQPMVTLLRRSGKMSCPADSDTLLPTESDNDVILELKWKGFIKRESYKRLVTHVFFHDAQSAIGLCKRPLLSYSELCFSLPASRDLWRASSAKEWRDLYLMKNPISSAGAIPRLAEIIRDTSALDGIGDRVDVELVYMTFIYAFWGQVDAYREAMRFHNAGVRASQSNASLPLWLKTQQSEVYGEISEFSAFVQMYVGSDPHMLLLLELIMMILHVSPDELQKFAGKNGEDEARRATQSMEENWAGGMESRYAAWHAGQVLRQARRLTPESLRGFNAIAVYFAGLTLWAYSICTDDTTNQWQLKTEQQRHTSSQPILLDGESGSRLGGFLQESQGTPALRQSADSQAQAEPISDSDAVLSVARGVLRDGFSARDEPLPPLVQSLEVLLRDLGSDQMMQASRESSEEAKLAEA